MSPLLFGGLRPLWSRLFLDIISVIFLSFYLVSASSSTDSSKSNTINYNRRNLLLLCFVVVLNWRTAGLTKRWTLTFPLIPFLLLQGLRYIPQFQDSFWVGVCVTVLSAILLLFAVLLCILFPAVQPPPIKGKYKIGVIDLYLPIHTNVLNNNNNNSEASNSSSSEEEKVGHVTARIFYPTNEEAKGSSSISYLRRDVEHEFLRESILGTAPPPINRCHWFLDSWKLISVADKRNAKPLMQSDEKKKFPVVAFSHGLGGSAAIYSQQTRSLAANGYVVISIDHTDGSNPATKTKDGSMIFINRRILNLWNEGKKIEYVEKRREQTEWRARELAGAVVAMKSLNEHNIVELESMGISFVNRLDTKKGVHVMGHSFGGVTAFTVAFRRPDLIHSIIAHEPATDWTPNDVRRQIFPDTAVNSYNQKIRDGVLVDGPKEEYHGGTGGWGTAATTTNLTTNLNDIPALILFSYEWYKNGESGMVRLFELMQRNGFLGPQGEFGFIKAAHHIEFSDTCFLTPLWLGRACKFTGTRNPIDTSEEIASRTLAFLEKLD